jgi:Tfp pilus assembly ATPase PilU
MNLDAWLKMLADEGGSDLYLTTGAPPPVPSFRGS